LVIRRFFNGQRPSTITHRWGKTRSRSSLFQESPCGSTTIIAEMGSARSTLHAYTFFFIAFILPVCTRARLLQENEAVLVVSENEMQAFQHRQSIKAGYQLPLQKIDPERNSVTLPDGTIVSLDGLQPKSMYTTSAECFHDHVQVACSEPTVFAKTDENGLKVIVSKDANGNIMNILVGQENSGQSIKLEAVAPGILTYIPPEAFDEEYYNQFVLADPLLSSSIGDQIRRQFREQNKTDQEENDNDIHRRRDRRSLAESCNGEYRVIEVALASESSFCQKIGVDDVESTINSIMADVAFDFEIAGLCFTTQISYRESYCDGSIDPYVEMVSSEHFLASFALYWNTRRLHVKRDVAEMFTGTPLAPYPCPTENNPDAVCTAVGMALGVGPSCAYLDFLSYGINHVTFSGNAQARSNLVSHEIGHTIGKEDACGDILLSWCLSFFYSS
jgi:hypothetical protein